MINEFIMIRLNNSLNITVNIRFEDDTRRLYLINRLRSISQFMSKHFCESLAFRKENDQIFFYVKGYK